MKIHPISECLLALLICATSIGAQETEKTPDQQQHWGYGTSSPRFFLDADVGIRGELGFLPPSSDFGTSFEYPLLGMFEMQGAASFSPDRKKITHDGHSVSVDGKAIMWPYGRLGVFADVGWNRLWTSQFTEGGTGPSFGSVIRTSYEYPGRLYISYLLPTGCVWATSSNPCKLQSKRLQGFSFTQEFQFRPHIRWGVDAGVYHFCDQSNPDDPAVARKCHWAGTEMLFVRFQFPGWRRDGAY